MTEAPLETIDDVRGWKLIICVPMEQKLAGRQASGESTGLAPTPVFPLNDRPRRLINSASSLSQLIKYEPLVDDTINVFIARLRKMFVRDGSLGPIMNMMELFAYFSLDVIIDITFGGKIWVS